MKIIASKENRFLIKDESKDYHCKDGLVKSEDMKKAEIGDKIKTNTGKEFTVLEADFMDLYNRIKRIAQIIPQKDIGLIITELGLNRDSVVIESGAGSGALGCFLSGICKKIYSYEIREDFIELVEKNKEMLGIKNLEIKHRDAAEGFDEKDVDAIILDLPSPWEIIDSAKRSLKAGGYLVSYSPTIPQAMDFVNALDKDFVHIKTSEIIEREWEIKGRKVRPFSKGIGHSGFISFARRI